MFLAMYIFVMICPDDDKNIVEARKKLQNIFKSYRTFVFYRYRVVICVVMVCLCIRVIN